MATNLITLNAGACGCRVEVAVAVDADGRDPFPAIFCSWRLPRLLLLLRAEGLEFCPAHGGKTPVNSLDTAPHTGGETSKSAADFLSKSGALKSMQAKVLRLLYHSRPDGLSAGQIKDKGGFPERSTAAARVRGLVLAGLVEKTGETIEYSPKGSSRFRRQFTWRLTPEGYRIAAQLPD